jgi:hypothetical protein
MENKQNNLQYLRQQGEKAQKKLHKPQINAKSIEIINRKTNRSFKGDDIHERLYRQRIKNLKQQDLDIDLQECTFTPQLYYTSLQGGNIDDFLERQKIYDEIKKERLERKLSRSIDESRYTFKPEINLTSDILIRTDNNRARENQEDKIDRLYKKNYEKIQSRKEQLETFYYGQYDFKPKINEVSRIVGREHRVEDLAKRNQKSKTRVIPDETEGCTFKPVLNQNNNIKSAYKFDENIGDRIQKELKAKDEKVEELKKYIKFNIVRLRIKKKVS